MEFEMFTGIVEELGKVLDRHDHADGGVTFRFQAPVVTVDAKLGDSIAVNGCCLTVTDFGDGWWQADAVMETIDVGQVVMDANGPPIVQPGLGFGGGGGCRCALVGGESRTGAGAALVTLLFASVLARRRRSRVAAEITRR